MRDLSRGLIPVFFIVCAWEAASRFGLLNPMLMPAPSLVLQSLIALAASGQLPRDIGQSLGHVGMGFLLAVVVGTPLGLAIGSSRKLAVVFDPPFQFLRPIPPLAWIPLAILWFGIGDAPSYFLTMIAALFPIVMNVAFGVRSISPEHFAVARTFGANRTLVMRRLIWPATLPFALEGYRIGLGMSWMTVVGAEMIAAPSGLGHLIHTSQDLLQTDRVIAGMVTIGVIGVIADLGLRKLEKAVAPWR